MLELVVGLTILIIVVQGALANLRLSDYLALKAKIDHRAQEIMQVAVETNFALPFLQFETEQIFNGFLHTAIGSDGVQRDLFPYQLRTQVASLPSRKEVTITLRWRQPVPDFTDTNDPAVLPMNPDPGLVRTSIVHLTRFPDR